MNRMLGLISVYLLLAACTLPQNTEVVPTAPVVATTQVAVVASATFTSLPAPTQTAALALPTSTSMPPLQAPTAASFCADNGPRAVITSLTSAVQAKDGALLASFVSPAHGMDVRYLHAGKKINYDVQHAAYVFQTTYQADWGLSPGSGQAVIGSFHDLVVPSLQLVLTSNPQASCEKMQTGGASYDTSWPYPNLNYYSLYYSGTAANGNLDWQTWAAGFETSSGKWYLAALVRFVWEP